MSDNTPMMRQYWSVKDQHRDAILFFRLGDFYEMFFEDAEIASKALDLTLTTRNKNQEGAVPLCGFPVHSSQGYIHRLLALGHKVAICEQTEDPKKAKGIVKREVIQVLTPGLVLDPECLEGKSNNYLASVCAVEGVWGIAFTDISTGSFRLTEIRDQKKMIDEIARLEPREILIEETSRESAWLLELKQALPEARLNPMQGWNYDSDFGSDLYRRVFEADVRGLGLADYVQAFKAGGALLSYLDQTKFLKNGILSRPQFYQTYSFMALDAGAKRNLELFETVADRERRGSLFWLLDSACTSMGSRQIRDWLMYPLIERDEIEARLDAVEEFYKNVSWRETIQAGLKSVTDIERIQNRILADMANARDLVALKTSLAALPVIKESLEAARSKELKSVFGDLDLLKDVQTMIESVLVEEPPFTLKEGGIIRDGIDPLLDELRGIEKNGKFTISSLEAKERESSGIGSLKIRFNSVFGYYIEITHAHKDKVPVNYIRKQTLTNAERYITPELKEYEDKVLGSAEKIRELEYQLFVNLRAQVSSHSERIKKTACALAKLDALASLGRIATEKRYCRPQITEEPVLQVKNGRHPLVEALHFEEGFVPNDLELKPADCRLMVITGPNMAGKSTVMRQAAIIALLAQIGSFVPAESATIGIVDRIFTRIGASDHLQKGLSTFMVEMLETAHILAHATERSLILLDEIGRGTSTFDGLSIAWAVAETIHDQVKARTLFATHYHELTDLAQEKPHIQNFHMSVREYNGQIRFLRELKKGGTNRSYGVSVAAMAGLPKPTILRAREILKLLEEKDLEFSSQAAHHVRQPSLFETVLPPVIEELKQVNVEAMTPLEALNFLAKIKSEL